MTAIDNYILWIKRSESPVARTLKKIARILLSPSAPRIPDFAKPPLRFFYEAHFFVIQVVRLLLTLFYRHPLFQARCKTFGKNVMIDGLPFVQGHVEIHIGNNCQIGGNITITSGSQFDNPRFIMGDNSGLGWNSQVVASKEVIIEEYARVSFNSRISDSDGHPREADLRAQNLPPHLRDIRPIRIGRHAWIGNSSHIMKGVTIGEGAIIGANSVVINDIPPYALALGNPAEVLIRNYGRPKNRDFLKVGNSANNTSKPEFAASQLEPTASPPPQ